MNIRKIILHIILIDAITVLLVLGMVYPFLPGDYDSLAMGLSTMTQVFGIVGLLLVPIGILWLVYELWKRNRPTKARRYIFVWVAVVIASTVAFIIAAVGLATVGRSLGLLTLVLWLY